jgi:uroporphyrinogen-III decarboxylase
LLKTVEDVKIYQHVLEKTVVEPFYEDLVATQAALGEAGVVDASGQCTPVMDLVMFHMGLENFVFMMEDHPGEINTLLDMMQEVRKEEYRVLAESPAEVVTTYENTSTTLLSPSYMARYEFPALAEYTEILHAMGKIHLVHMCGKVGGVLDQIADVPFDGIIDVAPPPTGDCDFRVARTKLCEAGKCLGGGIDCTAFVELTPEGMQEYVFDRLCETAPGTGYLLGSGDAVPFGTPMENLRAVVHAVQKYGTYPVLL